MEKKLYPVSIKFAVHVHATEDEKKVLLAIKNIFPENIDFKMKKFTYTGYYGNSIMRFEGTILRPKYAKEIFEYIFSKIEGIIYPEWIVERFDKKTNTLYLRLDKQVAYLGKIMLGWGDDIIHISFKFPGFLKIDSKKLEEIIEKLRKKKSEEL